MTTLQWLDRCRRPIVWSMVLIPCVLLSLPDLLWAGEPEPLTLRIGEAYETAMARGEHLLARVEISTPGLWRVTVEQRGIDLELRILDSAGRSVGHVASPLYRKGTLWWTRQIDAPGVYRLEVRTTRDTARHGEFALRVEDLSAASPDVVEAELAMTEAGTLYLEGTSPAWRQAFDTYGRAAELWRRAGDKAREGEVLCAMARLSHLLDEKIQVSVELLERAAVLFTELGDKRFEASARADIGLNNWQLGRLAEAEESLLRSVTLYRELNDPFGSGTALNTHCMVQHSRGTLRAALACYKEALAWIRQADSDSHEAAVLNNLGFANDSLGEPQAALDFYQQALEKHRATANRSGEAQVLNNIAAVTFRGKGDGEGALAIYEQAGAIYQAIGNRRQAAAVLHNQGETYRRLGNPQRALTFLGRALEIRREQEDPRGEMVTLNARGMAFWDQGEIKLARREHEEALALARRIERRRGEGLALAFLGRAEIADGDIDQGLQHLRDAIDVLAQSKDLFHLGWVHHELGASLLRAQRSDPTRITTAETELHRALTLRRQVADEAGQAETLEALARGARLRGDLDRAQAFARESIVLIETLQQRIVGSDIRMTFLATRAAAYETAIEILMTRHEQEPDAGFDHQALEMSERSRARTLLEVQTASKPIRPTNASEQDAAHRTRRRELEERLRAKADRLTRLRGRGTTSGRELENLEVEFQAILAELDLVPDARARQKQSSLPGIDQLRQALGTDTVLLEFALGEERSFLWWLDHQGLSSYVLPRRHEIDSAARRLHRAWSRPNSREGRWNGSLAVELSRQALGPIWERLDGRRLAVVADGALRHVPFAALPVPDASGSWTPLIADREVVALPSLSVLIGQRKRSARRELAPPSVAIFADPIFTADDPRLVSAEPTTPAHDEERGSLRSAWRSAALDLDRLPQSRIEAQRIADLAAGRNPIWLALDGEANRRHALDGRLRHYRTIHFATHGLVLETEPELSGLAFSMTDEDGRPVDGFLRLRDIYSLDLAAELVVLSGCRTALGRHVRGEGLVGLARAFLSAGAERVVASLWWVQDRATALLMARFYEALWVEGLRPAAALRVAQLSLRENRRYAHPAFWAPFVHQGDWE